MLLLDLQPGGAVMIGDRRPGGPAVLLRLTGENPIWKWMRASGRMKVSIRIYLGFGLTLVLLCIVGMIGGYGLEQSEERFDRFGQHADVAALGLEIDAHISEVRRASQSYFSTGEESQIAQARKAMSDLEIRLDLALSSIVAPADLLVVKDISEGFKSFEDCFGTFVEQQGSLSLLLSDTILTAETDLLAKAKALADVTAKAGDPAIGRSAWAVVQNEVLAKAEFSQFVANHDLEDFGQSKSALADLQTALDAVDGATQDQKIRALAGEIRTLKEAYAASLDDYATQRTEADTLFKQTMTNLGKQIAEKADGLRENALVDMAELKKTTSADTKLTKRWNMVLSAAALVIGAGLAWLIARGIIRPLVAMTETMVRLANNENSIDVPAVHNRDEIGGMARAVLVFKENAIRMGEMADQQTRQKDQAEQDKRRLMTALADAFDASVRDIVQAVTAASVSLQTTAEALNGGVEAVNGNAAAVAAAAEQATGNVESVASAADELSASIGEIGRQVTYASEVSGNALVQARNTGDIMTGLANEAQHIGDVVALINGVAARTNLLALNATIEAARAGDYGKGFAVVANEVKMLANQTAHATSTITQQIASVQSATQAGVAAIQAITSTINEISQISAAIASAVEEQSSATREIARNVEQAAAGTREVTTNIVGVTRGASQSRVNANEVFIAASDLSEQSRRLNDQVTLFIGQIRVS